MIPAALQEIVDDFGMSPKELRLQLLLDFSKGLPTLPERYRDRAGLEQVHECQTPFFLAVEIDDENRVHVYFDAPPEAPTTRGYAGILAEGLEGATPQEVLETPPDFYVKMGLAELISPLRLRGMGAILARIKRRVVELGGAG